MNNRTLLYIFLGLVAIFFATRFLRKDHTSTFQADLLTLDTSKVDRVKFISERPVHDEFELVRAGSVWQARKGNIEVTASPDNITGVLSQLADLNADRVVTKDASRYPEYEITDSLATRVLAFDGEKEIADLRLGGFRFDQAARTATAFVRKDDKPEVYQVDGFVMMSLKQNFDQYRDRSLLKADPNDLSKLEWMDNEGRKEAISKEDGRWHYAGMEAVDSSAMNHYLQSLVNTKGAEFGDVNFISGKVAIEKLTIYGNNMVAPVVISVFPNIDTLNPLLIHSSHNPHSVFLSDSMGIYKQVFADIRQFWPDGQ